MFGKTETEILIMLISVIFYLTIDLGERICSLSNMLIIQFIKPTLIAPGGV